MTEGEVPNSGDGDFGMGGVPGGIVTARGTADGLVVRLDSRVESGQLMGALREFLASRSGFLKGNGVLLEWVGEKPDPAFVARVTQLMADEFDVEVRQGDIKPSDSTSAIDGISPLKDMRGGESEAGGPLSLFDGIGAVDFKDDLSSVDDDLSAVPSSGGAVDVAFWDDPDARIYYGTLRSGQKVETEHSLVICGDVNSGAEVVAGGDILVLGTLRGVAHAGAYDETGGGRFIFALDLRPTQLRIGMVITRGSSDESGVPELARVDGNMIVVEKYQSRTSARGKR